MYTIEELYDLTHTLAAEYLRGFTYPWEALGGIRAMILELGPKLDPEQYAEVSPQVWVHRTATVAPTAYLGAPCIIGAGTEVRHGAFVRGSALVGENCVVGNSVELKNVILFDNVQTPHYNYVGDSILGYRSHMGAGSITSNVKSDKSLVVVHGQGENVETGLKKFGAMLGDFVEVGCNSVLNPGTVIGRESNVYPLSCVRGVVPARHIYKTGGVAVLRGNLAPDTGITKPGAFDKSLHHFEGEAICFDSEEEAEEAILSGKVHEGHVVVIRYEGPKGGPGMREMFKAMKYMYGVGLSKSADGPRGARYSAGQ